MFILLVYIIPVTSHICIHERIMIRQNQDNFWHSPLRFKILLSPRLLNDVKTRQTIITKNMLLFTGVDRKM
jgi:hypothetical protein